MLDKKKRNTCAGSTVFNLHNFCIHLLLSASSQRESVPHMVSLPGTRTQAVSKKCQLSLDALTHILGAHYENERKGSIPDISLSYPISGGHSLTQLLVFEYLNSTPWLIYKQRIKPDICYCLADVNYSGCFQAKTKTAKGEAMVKEKY